MASFFAAATNWLGSISGSNPNAQIVTKDKESSIAFQQSDYRRMKDAEVRFNKNANQRHNSSTRIGRVMQQPKPKTQKEIKARKKKMPKSNSGGKQRYMA